MWKQVSVYKSGRTPKSIITNDILWRLFIAKNKDRQFSLKVFVMSGVVPVCNFRQIAEVRMQVKIMSIFFHIDANVSFSNI